MARLIHINGLPGIGKTSLAELFAQRHPLALVVDIDRLRTQLGQWEARPESKIVARDLAIALIESHLGSGRDVVVPQYLGKAEFIQRLENTALTAGATFVEVLLVGEQVAAVERFRARRARFTDGAHPEGDVADSEVESMVSSSADSLVGVYDHRSDVHRVSADGDIEGTYAALLATIGEHPSSTCAGECRNA